MKKPVIHKSTVADRPTIGSLLYQTQEEASKQYVEVGEYVEEVGKHEYMKQLRESIEKRIGDPAWKDLYYLLVLTRKNAVLTRITEIYVQPRHTRPSPEPGLTLWSYDPSSSDLKLEWVLPNKHAFKMFLQTESYTDPFLIACIKKYQEGSLV